MLIDSYAPKPDAAELHQIKIQAPAEEVYRALLTADLGGAPVIKALLALRSLPEFVWHPRRPRFRDQKFTLQSLIDSGFGRLAEEPGREIVLGVAGRFWRPTGNILPFNEENFRGPVPAGLACAVWNFAVQAVSSGSSILSTETRVVCGDPASRLKFRAYWLIVGHFSGLIRRLMLNSVKQLCERN
jgi:hypothetical protein